MTKCENICKVLRPQTVHCVFTSYNFMSEQSERIKLAKYEKTIMSMLNRETHVISVRDYEKHSLIIRVFNATCVKQINILMIRDTKETYRPISLI